MWEVVTPCASQERETKSRMVRRSCSISQKAKISPASSSHVFTPSYTQKPKGRLGQLFSKIIIVFPPIFYYHKCNNNENKCSFAGPGESSTRRDQAGGSDPAVDTCTLPVLTPSSLLPQGAPGAARSWRPSLGVVAVRPAEEVSLKRRERTRPDSI